jgi:hypothetical protein
LLNVLSGVSLIDENMSQVILAHAEKYNLGKWQDLSKYKRTQSSKLFNAARSLQF